MRAMGLMRAISVFALVLLLALPPGRARGAGMPPEFEAADCDRMCDAIDGDFCKQIRAEVKSATSGNEPLTIASRGDRCQINGTTVPRGGATSCDELAAMGRVCGATLAQAKPYCTSYHLQKPGSQAFNWNLVLMVVEVVGATLCWIACGYKPMEAACTIAGIGVNVSNIAGATQIATSGEFQSFMASAGPVGAALGLMGPSMVGDLVGKISSEAGNSVKENSSCVSAGVYTLLAGLRVPNLVDMSSRSEGDCRRVRELATSSGVEMRTGGWDYKMTDSGEGAAIRVGGGQQTGGAAISAVGGVRAAARDELIAGGAECLLRAKNPGDCESAFQSAVSAGGWDRVGGPLGGKGARSNPLPFDLKALARAARTGGTEGLGRAMAAQMGQGASGPMQELVSIADRATKDPDKYRKMLGIESKDSAGPKLAAASKAPPAGTKPSGPFLDWGARTPANIPGEGAASVVKFDAPKPKYDPESADIFHEGFQGTIFEIISHRLGRSRERVVEMEWQTPLNRALTGLRNPRPAVNSAEARKPAQRAAEALVR